MRGRGAKGIWLSCWLPRRTRANVQVAGPQDAKPPVRELPAERVLDLLQTASSMAVRQAASFLAREFGRLEDSVVPGLKVKDLLTPYFARERLRWPANSYRLAGALGRTPPTGSVSWRPLLSGYGLPGATAAPPTAICCATMMRPGRSCASPQRHLAPRWPYRTRDPAGGAGAG